MQGAFSAAPLRALLAAGHSIVSVVVSEQQVDTGAAAPPAADGALHLHRDDTINGIAEQSGIPIICFQANAGLPVCDVMVVACFSRRIPRSVRALARRAAVNLHPSSLPEFRGPAPLFWQLRAGLRSVGVSLHLVTDELDSGPLIAQCMVALPTGAGGRELDTLLADAGSALLVDALARGDFEATAQVGEPSVQGWPAAADWLVPCEWRVLRAFNFMRGTADWGVVYTVAATSRRIAARTVLGYRLDSAEPGVVREVAGGLEIGFVDGWLTVI